MTDASKVYCCVTSDASHDNFPVEGFKVLVAVHSSEQHLHNLPYFQVGLAWTKKAKRSKTNRTQAGDGDETKTRQSSRANGTHE